MATLPETLAIAVQHHQAGRLPEAEALYRQILHLDWYHLRPDYLEEALAKYLVGSIGSMGGK